MRDPNEKNIKFIMIKKIISIIITVLLVFTALIIGVQKFTDNSFLGFRIYIVATGSMEPVYNTGDVIFVKEVDESKLDVNDDVVYEGKSGSVAGMTITHRIIRIEEDSEGKIKYITKGLANNLEDPAITYQQIRGKVIHKLLITTFICSLAQNKYTIYFLLVIPVTFFIFFKIIHVSRRKDR